MSGPLVGIDLGGTAIKAGALASDGRVLARREVDAGVERGPRHVCALIASLARELGCSESLGLGAPGLLDRERGAVIASPNLAPIEGFPLRDELARALGLAPERVVVENDANVAAIGEQRLGGARGERDVLVITLGTGIGGGLILDGRLHAGEGGMAGEVGHLVVEPNGPLCGCGRRGCLETLASATAAKRRALEVGLEPDLAHLADLARAGDQRSRALFADVGRDLGHGLALCVTLLDLRCFLVGGGFGAAIDVLEPGIARGFEERCYGRDASALRILRAGLGTDAGWIGAALLGGDRASSLSE